MAPDAAPGRPAFVSAPLGWVALARACVVTPSVRFKVFNRDGFKCRYCGKCAPDVTLHVDHITPISRGGGNRMANLITACAECNLGKGIISMSDENRAELLAFNEQYKPTPNNRAIRGAVQ